MSGEADSNVVVAFGVATHQKTLRRNFSAAISGGLPALDHLPLLLMLRDDGLCENAREEKLREREKGASFGPFFVSLRLFFFNESRFRFFSFR